MKPVRILVAAGSSGGHIFPALAFLESLKEKYPDNETLLLLPEKSRGKIDCIDGCGYKIRYIPLASVRFSLKREDLKNLLGLFKAILQSLRILLDFHPDIVVGFGSATSVPVVILAWLLRVKTLIHEQNVIPGKANKLLAEFSDKVAVSFAESREYLKRHRNKTVTTGNPLRKKILRVDKQEARDYFGFSKDKLTILVMGGSQGSSNINDGFLNALSLLKDKAGLQVIHLAGSSDYALIKERYNDLGAAFALFDFFAPMHYAYCASDLALSRAGATTIAELIFYGLPSILVPYPYAYEHQYANAKVLEEKGCAVIIKDKDLNAKALKENLEALILDRSRLDRMRTGFIGLKADDAAGQLVKEVVSLN
jgi:UDP-N-acetylglucosamine--N-acetylmuramyl-(pentapeptide) pyrophosphoryl-undecaprenol N-acetylglucosamine transferase